MAELTGQPMSKIVNWFMMLIIFVFDPLAIAMVVAANMAFAKVKGVARDPKDYEVYQEKELTDKEKKAKYIKEEGDLSGPREKSSEVMEKIPSLPPKPIEVNIEVTDKIEKPKDPPPPPKNSSWGSPGGVR